jgi:hypothetical protein
MPDNVDTFIDGCGVVSDTPIGTGTRIRFRLEDDRQQDISVYLEDGVLHVLGMYRPLVVVSVEDNHVDVSTIRW